MIGIEAVDLDQLEATLSNGEVVPITHMYDCEGDETDDPEECVAFCCGREGMWFSCRLGPYTEPPTIH